MKLIITDVKDLALRVAGEHKIIKPTEKEPKQCIGCFGCWNKTPGECVIKDGFDRTGSEVGKCDELIMVSECIYGGFSSFVKKVQDRAISLVRPDFQYVNGEMHHRRRYFKDTKLTAVFYGNNITEEEKQTAEGIVRANAKNFYYEVKRVRFLNDKNELEGLVL